MQQLIDSSPKPPIIGAIEINIRKARLTDAPFIINCNVCLASETESRCLELATVTQGVEALLADESKGIYFVAEADGQPIGQLLITYEWSDWRNGNFWWIQSVYVAEKFRGQGVFRALFTHVHTLARARANKPARRVTL